MSIKQPSLHDLSNTLNKALAQLDKIEERAIKNNPELSFEQKIIKAVRAIDNGDPLKDELTIEEIHEAIRILGDVYTVTGVKMPEDWY